MAHVGVERIVRKSYERGSRTQYHSQPAVLYMFALMHVRVFTETVGRPMSCDERGHALVSIFPLEVCREVRITMHLSEPQGKLFSEQLSWHARPAVRQGQIRHSVANSQKELFHLQGA